jgi:hypothetical protein
MEDSSLPSSSDIGAQFIAPTEAEETGTTITNESAGTGIEIQ